MGATLFLIFATLDRFKSIQILYQLLKPIFFLKYGRDTTKSSQTWKSGSKFSWNIFCGKWPQNRKFEEPNFLWIQQTKVDGSVIGYIIFWFCFFNLWPHPIFAQKTLPKCSQNTKSNFIFYSKERRDTIFTWTYLDSSKSIFFLDMFYFPWY